MDANPVELNAGPANTLIDVAHGARLASLVVARDELLVGHLDSNGIPRPRFEWGSYPMSPFAGRIRFGRFDFGGRRFEVERRMEPHAIHGMVDDVEWTIVERANDSLRARVDVDHRWPFACSVEQSFVLRPDRLRIEGTLTAREPMPAQIGWHPWFRRPAAIDLGFAQWLPRDHDGLPIAQPTADPPSLDSTVDDCFLGTGEPIVVRVGTTRLELTSDCSHWVVYNGAPHGVCVEPQSGPPNAVETGPLVLEPGESLRRWFEIAWPGSEGPKTGRSDNKNSTP